MIWTRDAEDSLTYVKSNKKVRRVFFAGLCGAVAWTLDSRSSDLGLSANRGHCVGVECFTDGSEKVALIKQICIIVLSLEKKVIVVNESSLTSVTPFFVDHG